MEEVELPSLTLAYIELESTLSDTLWVTAVQDPEGGFRLVVHDEYETAFAPPISHATEPLKLGELIRILDETVWEEEENMAGIGHAFRDRCTQGDQTRAECVEFVAVRSQVYPQLQALDAARGRAWASEAD